MYSGDDMARDLVCPEKKSWSEISKHLTLQSKPVVSEAPTFCGWIITKESVIRDPFKLYIAYHLSKDLNKVHDVAVSYRQDILPAYLLKDDLNSILNEEQMEYHRDLCRNLHIEEHITFNNNEIGLDNALHQGERPESSRPKYKLNTKQRRRYQRREKEKKLSYQKDQYEFTKQ